MYPQVSNNARYLADDMVDSPMQVQHLCEIRHGSDKYAVAAVLTFPATKI